MLGTKLEPNEDCHLECQRMGKPRKNFSIKEFLSKNKADLIMLQETKKQSINKTCSSSLWEGKIKIGFFLRLMQRPEAC